MKITKKQLDGYKKAKREWITANDNYNREYYGITQAEYHKIKQAEYAINGICGNQILSLSKINKELKYI